MITKDELTENQQKSFDQMTSNGGLGDEEALELIQELTVDKGYTGLRVNRFKLTPEGQKVALEVAHQQEVKMECEKCQDRGFTEREHGLVMVLCDCDKAKEVAKREGIPWGEERESPITVFEVSKINKDGAIKTDVLYNGLGEVGNDSSSGTGRTDTIIGGADTSKPKRIRKPKTKKKARARTS